MPLSMEGNADLSLNMNYKINIQTTRLIALTLIMQT